MKTTLADAVRGKERDTRGWRPMLAISHTRLVAGLVLFTMALGPATMQGSSVVANGYTFTNFDFPNAGNAVREGTNVNGIANNGVSVGFSINNNGSFTNFVGNADGTFTALNLAGSNAMAFGINSAGDVVGQQNGAAFLLAPGGSPQTLQGPSGMSIAFGINDQGVIAGQYSVGPVAPGFVLMNGHLITINAPAGPDTVFAQGINDNGLVAGFYVGVDGQDHGFDGNIQNANSSILNGTAIADPTIPNVAGEPGATFVFSQILGVNDNGIAVGYYGDSTTSQHGFLYNTNTGVYTFLDDPAEQFNNGVEITQITGISNSGEISGFYSDGSGVFHGFVACPAGVFCTGSGGSPVPEPSAGILASLGLALLGLGCFRRRKTRAGL
jgi:hypothetical protein